MNSTSDARQNADSELDLKRAINTGMASQRATFACARTSVCTASLTGTAHHKRRTASRSLVRSPRKASLQSRVRLTLKAHPAPEYSPICRNLGSRPSLSQLRLLDWPVPARYPSPGL